ncbi:hypothetical protein A2853_02885 [Candidatus Kaiserbacteria bacterium RIFCSPHIGHO2_01_FULL_55_17]|uniref:DUF192 domain-containing protein n=1 Tax=Candidatus Kaiserbacteria bacterium RIFCSPHIGHO2_01_FULL_55_17 TaxID=1798484 RepID=A0A1F6DBC3_9BACT|nr:MAG: hypothetical protein A2853_02885 [Candidatus Kaiserbacteria bacterium RIFCSPHIGHO2_01_FULL_55_17]
MLRQVKYAVVVAGVVLLAALIYIDLPGFPADQNDTAVASSTVQLKGRTIRVTLADTPEEREKGLSGWNGLSEDEGMLFVFEDDGKPAFWMKDMKFAIDILWISREGMVVDMRQDVSPETYPTAFAPRSEARYVLELPAGYTETHQIRLEDIVRL